MSDVGRFLRFPRILYVVYCMLYMRLYRILYAVYGIWYSVLDVFKLRIVPTMSGLCDCLWVRALFAPSAAIKHNELTLLSACLKACPSSSGIENYDWSLCLASLRNKLSFATACGLLRPGLFDILVLHAAGLCHAHPQPNFMNICVAIYLHFPVATNSNISFGFKACP